MKISQPIGIAGGLTAGALTPSPVTLVASNPKKFSWSNAMVAGIAGTSGNLLICTLPAKTMVKKAWIVITGQAAGTTTLTVSAGRTGAAYIDYLVAKNAKVAANTVYGQIVAELGANLTALTGDLPSLSATTDINLQFVSSIENLSNVTGSSGDIYLETLLIP